MNLLKSLAGPKKHREASGPLTGRQLPLGDYLVRVEAVVGEGGFATIYRAVDVNTQMTYALKHFRLSGDPDAERDVMTEVNVMRSLSDCPYILRLYQPCKTKSEAFLLIEYCDGGTMAGYMMERGSSLSNEEVTAAFIPVARAVAALHAMNPPLAHRDIKAENVLRRADGSWVLCDFGSVTEEHKIYSSPGDIAREEDIIMKHTTPAYRAPELWDLYCREFIGTAVDVWSLGCLLYLIAYGKLPFDGDAKLQILNGKYAMPAMGLRPAGVEHLLADMLALDPKKRITAAEVVNRAAGMMSGGAAGRIPTSSSAAAAGKSATTVPAAIASRPTPAAAGAVAPSRRGPMGASAMEDVWGQEFDTVASHQPFEHPQQGPGSGGGWADFDSVAPAADSSVQAQIHRNSSSGMSNSGVNSVNAPNNMPRRPVSAASTATAALGVSAARPPSSSSSNSTGAELPTSGRSSSAATPSAVAAAAAIVSKPPSSSAAAAAAAAAPTSAMAGLNLDASSQMQEHCQVLEQLLEERQKEVATLRAELKRQERHTTDTITALKAELDDLKTRLSKAEAEKTAALRQITGSSTPSLSTGGLAGMGRVSSFPLSGTVEESPQKGHGMGGEPMRRTGSSSASGRSSPQKKVSPSAAGPTAAEMAGVTGRQNSFFRDLNPLG